MKREIIDFSKKDFKGVGNTNQLKSPVESEKSPVISGVLVISCIKSPVLYGNLFDYNI